MPLTIRRHAPACLLLAALSLAVCAPILWEFTTAVPGWEGDNLYFVRTMWWVKHAVLDLNISPFFDPTSYVPDGYDRSRGETALTSTLLFLPVTAVFGPIVAYNTSLVFSFAASGWTAYFWIYLLTRSRSAGVVSGAIAAFLPMRFAHLPGHLSEMNTQWITLALGAFEWFLERRSAPRAALLGVSVALTALGCWYYGYSLALMFPIYVVARLGWRSPLWREQAWWRGVAVAVVTAGLLVLPALAPMLKLTRATKITRSLGEMDSWAMSPWDVFLPNLVHPIWGNYLSLHFLTERALWSERGLSLGYLAVGLALIGLFAPFPRRIKIAALAVWVASWAIALGPTLHMSNRRVNVPVPAVVEAMVDRVMTSLGPSADEERARLRAEHSAPIPLPSMLLYFYAPMAASMRVMARFGLWTGLMTAALAGLGVARLMPAASRRWPRAAVSIPVALAILVTFESLPMLSMFPLAPRPVDLYLRDQPGAVVLEMPLSQARRPLQDYYATVHERGTVISWIGDSFAPRTLASRVKALSSFPSPESIEYLASLGVTHLLLMRTPADDATAERLRSSPRLEYDRRIGDTEIFRIKR